VARGIGGGCDEEALRVINAMPKWKPGKQNGRAVKVFFSLAVKFVLQ
jgi:protein TonB